MAEPNPSFVLRRVNVLDAGGGFAEGTDVLVENGVISAVAAELSTDASAFDAEGLWLMPGIADCHVHLGSWTDSFTEMIGLSVTRWSMEVARNARLLLGLGITLARDPGTSDAGIRDGISSGAVPGPTMQVSGTFLSQTGGHADGFLPNLGAEAMNGLFIPEHPSRGPYLTDGVDEMRAAVRELVRLGVDWIKLCTTGGLLSTGRDHPNRQEYSLEEVEVAVEEATRAGVPVCVHAYGGPGLEAAVAAGVKSIEHGIHLTEEQAAEMARRGCWLVPTLAVVAELAGLADAGEVPPYVADKIREVQNVAGQQVQIAREAGVSIALGTDLIRQGPNLSELALLGKAGMPVEEVLLTATSRGAELLGQGDFRGRIEPGYAFDAILLDRDPSDLAVFEDQRSVTGVFKGGAAVLPHARWRAEGLPLPQVTIG